MSVYTLLVIVVSGISGTGLMTLFSHLVAKFRNQKFNEAQLLNTFIKNSKLLPSIDVEKSILGYIIHYGVGIIIAAMMFWYYKLFGWSLLVWKGVILGITAWIFGAISWLLLFNKHNNPPNVNVKEFLFQLFFAHCIFGVTTALVMEFLK